jgi:hypothetical protein
MESGSSRRAEPVSTVVTKSPVLSHRCVLLFCHVHNVSSLLHARHVLGASYELQLPRLTRLIEAYYLAVSDKILKVY